MKSSIFYNALLAAPLAVAITPPSVDGMKLTWHDDFAGHAGQEPDQKEWDYRLDISTNKEHQTYTDSNKNIQLSGGKTLQIVPWKDKHGNWTSGRVETKDSWNAQPGKQLRYQVSLRFGDATNKAGIWNAAWMMGDAVRHGTEWPLCGELDLMENLNGKMEAHGTVHCSDKDVGGICDEPNGIGSIIAIPNSDFHQWAIQVDRTSKNWKTETITWSMDGNAYQTLSGSDIGDEGVWSTLAHSPFFLILNVAVGGSWPGPPNDDTEDGYANMLEVEYAAVYETK